MTLLDRMLARVGKERSDVKGSTALGKLLRQQGVPDSPEVRRVLDLPRRRWEEYDLEELGAMLEEVYRLPGSTMRLRPVQVASLADLHDFGGLVGPVRVGAGKTLISFLAPTILGAKRPLLVIPGGLRQKTLRDFAKLEKEWVAHPNLRIESYERLGQERGNEILQEIQPDLLILDEAHRVKNPRAAVTRRVKRWMDEHPETTVAALSGTLISRSINDYGHTLWWCLDEKTPLPRRHVERQKWAQAIDEKLPPTAVRLAPGALSALLNTEEKALVNKTVAVRRAFRRRLVETPGVVATEEGFTGASLRLQALEFEPSKDVADALVRLRNYWERPDGVAFTEPMEVWRTARTLALGFYYKWDPEAPLEWLLARKAWSAAVRHVISNNAKQLDSELPVKRACERGEYDRSYVRTGGILVYDEPIGELYRRWKEIEPTFEPNPVPVWIDDAALQAAAKWMIKNKGIVWTEHRAFGERLAEITGRPYFAQKGLDSAGNFIDDSRPEDGSIIASIAANLAGRNLQHWSQALVVSCAPSGLQWEQLLGRLHRDGQEADEVVFDVMIGTIEQYESFERAVENGHFQQDMTGQAQKLVYADKVMPDAEEIASRAGALWNK